MEHPFPRDGLLEKDIEAATSIRDVEARQDAEGNVWLIVKRDELNKFLNHCGTVDKFLERVEEMGGDIPESLGR